MTVLVSEASNKSQWVYQEIELSKKFHKPILPVTINNAPIPRELSGTWQAASFTGQNYDYVILEAESILQRRSARKTFLSIIFLSVVFLSIVFLLTLRTNYAINQEQPNITPNEATLIEMTVSIVAAPTLKQIEANRHATETSLALYYEQLNMQATAPARTIALEDLMTRMAATTQAIQTETQTSHS